MGDKTKIEWTDASWNPVRGCSRVSEGCRNCYAERQAARFSGPGQPYNGLVALRAIEPERKHSEARWTGVVRLIPEHLGDPLRWKRPRRVFVNSMSDLFHEALSDDDIAAIFGVMAAAPQHTFQILTKRAKRMREWFAVAEAQRMPTARHWCVNAAENALRDWRDGKGWWHGRWPLPNVWLGVSVEDQATADARIPELLATPAALRWVSYEPALAAVDFVPFLSVQWRQEGDWLSLSRERLNWVVVGGESGPGARPFDLEWARSTIRQCREAGVPCFVKQVGAWHVATPEEATGTEAEWVRYHDRKGGDPAEWPEDLRVREMPPLAKESLELAARAGKAR